MPAQGIPTASERGVESKVAPEWARRLPNTCHLGGRRQGLCSHLAHLWATSDSSPCLEAVGTPRGGMGYVATLPTCGPLVNLPPRSEAVGIPLAAGVM